MIRTDHWGIGALGQKYVAFLHHIFPLTLLTHLYRNHINVGARLLTRYMLV